MSEFLGPEEIAYGMKVISEEDLELKRIEDIIYQRLTYDGKLKGKQPSIPVTTMKRMYELMLIGRRFDEKATSLSTLREIGTYAPCRGQEAVQVGFALALSKDDWLVPMYRDSAAMIAFGLPAENLLLYWGGDERGMKIPQGVNLLPIAVPVSTQLPHAVGLALGMKKKKENSVVLTSTGDGGTSKGDFHEALNFAGVYRAPVVFAVENNQWAISVRREMQTASKTLAQKAVAYGFEGILVDGNDVIACHEATLYAVEKARQGKGPTLIEFYTYRMGPHTTAELVSNRLKAPEEVELWEKRDPIKRFEKYLLDSGIIDESFITSASKMASDFVDEAVSRFRSYPKQEPRSIFDYLYSSPTERLREQLEESLGIKEPAPPEEEERRLEGGKEGINIRNAINMALREEMRRNEKIVVFGEDVGKNGGVFQVTRGLQEEFGEERVFDTPLAEACIAGIFVGLAVSGMVPVAEFQFEGFTPPAYDQIFGHIARMRNRTRGRYNARGVIRFPYGAGVKAPEQHSDSPETYFAHTPGLKVVVPSNPYDAKGLLISSLRSEDPVIFMEPKKLYDTPKMSVPEEEYTVPIGKARVLRDGTDITIVSYGAMLLNAEAAANTLSSKYSKSVELIDLRTISPLDEKTILNSVRKTGRIVVVHEAPKNLGVAAEISAIIAEKAVEYLKAPIRRVTGYDTVVPLARLEDFYLPGEERIVKACLDVLSY